MIKKIALLVSGFAALTCAGILNNKSATICRGEEFSFVSLNDEYKLNDSIVVPGALLNVNSQSFRAKHIVTFPSGIKTYESSLILNEVGTYKLEYYYIYNNLYYSKVETFRVVSSFFNIGGSSSAYYGVPEESGTEGLIVELAPNEELVFNSGLDLSKITLNDEFINAYIAPYTRGNSDFATLVFTLFNPNKPEEYLRFKLSEIPSERLYPALATVNMQGNGTDTIGDDAGNKNLIHRNDGQGTKTLVSFKGRTASYITTDGKDSEQVPCLTAPYDTTKFRLVVDYATKSAYTYNPWFSFDGTISNPDGHGRIIVGDLDDTDYVNNKLWSGFSCDLVKLKVSAERYSGNKARFVLTKVKGLDLYAEALEDLRSPIITIENSPSTLPNGVIGCNYPVFKAKAVDDVDGEVKVNISVWKNYGKSNASNVEIKDWYFTPKSNGEYSIVYEAFDNSGNRSEEILNIFVSDDYEPINIEINESEKITSVYLGSTIVLPSAIYNGGSGSLSLKIVAKLNEYEEIIKEDRKFSPIVNGNWTIKYIVTDFIGVQKEETYQISVVKSDKAILAEEFYGDEYIVSYSDYKIPTPKIIKYINDEIVEPNFDVKVTINGTKNTYHRGDTVYFGNVENRTKALFEYYCESEMLTSFEAEVINPFVLNEYQAKQLAINNYFISENANIVFEEPEVSTPSYEIGAKIISRGASINDVRFANYVLSELFKCEFTTFKENSIFTSIDVKITDSINKNNSLTVNISHENGAYFASVGQDKKFLMNESNRTYDEFSISYRNGKLFVCTAVFDVVTNDQNVVFEGFNSRKVSFEMRINDLKNSSYIILNKINNQNIIKSSRNLVDYITPEIDISEDINGTYDLNDIISTPIATAQDVLAQNASLSVSVYLADNYEPVKDIDGNEITNLSADVSHKFKLDGLQTYIISYSTSEEYNGQKYWQRRNVLNELVSIICLDKESPVIRFTSFFPQTCNVNDVVMLPTFEVLDNDESHLEIKRYMMLPNGLSTTIDENIRSYQFTNRGVYEYRVVVIDSSRNIGVNSLYITVL